MKIVDFLESRCGSQILPINADPCVSGSETLHIAYIILSPYPSPCPPPPSEPVVCSATSLSSSSVRPFSFSSCRAGRRSAALPVFVFRRRIAAGGQCPDGTLPSCAWWSGGQPACPCSCRAPPFPSLSALFVSCFNHYIIR